MNGRKSPSAQHGGSLEAECRSLSSLSSVSMHCGDLDLAGAGWILEASSDNLPGARAPRDRSTPRKSEGRGARTITMTHVMGLKFESLAHVYTFRSVKRALYALLNANAEAI